VCDQFRIVPAALLMVGDSGYDLDAARAAGAPCVLLDYGYADVRALQPDAVASNLVEVIEMVKNGRLP
jgi:phosphoglycolate phosphatase